MDRPAAPITTYLLGLRRRQPATPTRSEIERLAARAQALAEGWDRPADAPDPDDVDDEVPDDSARRPHRRRRSSERPSTSGDAAVIVREPAAPRSWPYADAARPRARAGRGRCSTSRPPRSTVPTCCSGRASTRRRPAPRTSSAWSAAAPSRRSARGVDGLGGRRRGVRPARRRRLRRPGRRPGRPGDAGARRRRPGDRRGAARGRVHGLVQRVHGRRAAAGRDASWCTAAPAASAPSRSSSRSARRRPGAHHRRLRPEKLALCADARRRRDDQLPRRGLRRGRAGGDRRAGADVILDNMGATYLGRNVDALATEGRLVVIGMQGGTKGRARPRRAAAQARRGRSPPRCGRARSAEKAAICAAVVEHVWPLVADGHGPRRSSHGTMPLDGGRAPRTALMESGDAHRQDPARRLTVPAGTPRL